MSAPVGTLQVVPDIDTEKEEKKPVVKSSQQQSSAKKLTSSDVKLSTAPVHSHSPNPRVDSPQQALLMSQRVALVRRRGQSALHPPIQQMSSDAQPLTSAELLAHRQLLHVQRIDANTYPMTNRQ